METLRQNKNHLRLSEPHNKLHLARSPCKREKCKYFQDFNSKDFTLFYFFWHQTQAPMRVSRFQTASWQYTKYTEKNRGDKYSMKREISCPDSITGFLSKSLHCSVFPWHFTDLSLPPQTQLQKGWNLKALFAYFFLTGEEQEAFTAVFLAYGSFPYGFLRRRLLLIKFFTVKPRVYTALRPVGLRSPAGFSLDTVIITANSYFVTVDQGPH